MKTILSRVSSSLDIVFVKKLVHLHKKHQRLKQMYGTYVSQLIDCRCEKEEENIYMKKLETV
jgi:hypothetical protein